MAAVNRFMIGFTDENGGLQTNYKPWLIADNAFSALKNAYIYRGRLRKRFGSTLMGPSQLSSRLRMNIGKIKGPLNIPGSLAIGQMFSVGTDTFNVHQLGAGVVTLSTDPAATCTINSVLPVNTVSFAGVPFGSTVYWYPSTAVMGITQYETQPINDETTVAFDTTFSYYFDEATTGWERLATGADTWTGTDSDFFWCANYQGLTPDITLLWATNYVEADGIRYWDDSTWVKPTLQYANNTPGPNNIITCRIIIQFKNRLLFLNTVESVDGANKFYVNRCRYSAIGSPLAADAWRQDIPGNGSAIDAPTQEAIVTAQFLRDHLIVYFERSTWELVYNGNQAYPFFWQRINTELGAESTFSQVPFDKAVLGVGNVGIHACNGASVDRVDAKIPQLVFSFHNQNSGPMRIAGIRDYRNELVYWTYPDINQDADFPYPNKVLVYNYKNNSWGINDDSFTCFGYYQLGAKAPSITWESADMTWEELGTEWNSPLSSNVTTQTVIAGNQQGWMFVIEDGISRNAESLQVTQAVLGVLTVIDHNLAIGEYAYLENLDGTSVIIKIDNIVDKDNVTTSSVSFASYDGGSTLARISRIDIQTKQYNFFLSQDKNAFISRVDFMVDRTDAAEYAIDFFTSTGIDSGIEDGTATGALSGTSILETSPYALAPYEATQAQLWHPVYLQAEGTFVQLRIFMNDDQMVNEETAFADFQLHAMIFFAQPASTRLQ